MSASAVLTPTVTSVAVQGDGRVDIHGTHLGGPSRADFYFGGVKSSNVSFISDNEVVATPPPGNPGTVDVVVQTYRGLERGTSPMTTADQYTY